MSKMGVNNVFTLPIYGAGYWECAGPFLKFVVHDTLKFIKNASSEPGLFGQTGLPA